MKKSLQTKVREVLTQSTFPVVLGGIEYQVPHPTLGTIVRASEMISLLPEFTMDKKDAIKSILKNAKECHVLGEIMAVFIIGEKSIVEMDKKAIKGFFLTKGKKTGADAVKELGETIMCRATPAELNVAMAAVFSNIEIADFFEVTTFLQGINLTKPTKVVETTQSGQ